MQARSRGWRIGIDIGGTFTDLLLVSRDGEAFHIGKVLTTPADPVAGVLRGLGEVLAAAAVPAPVVDHVVHGTTLLTNALIERKGARTALLTTAGFRDALEIAREHRYDMYDLSLELPRPLVPRPLRREVRERLLPDGTVLTPLDLDGAGRLLEDLRGQGVEAVAVSLLHSYANPAHERALGRLIAERWPGCPASLSSEVAPEIREYERTSTTVANAYIRGVAEGYLRKMEGCLREEGIRGRLFVMQSNGGICGVDAACRVPVRVLESGPAAGALAAAHYGATLGLPDLLSFDMGGTTAKACLIEGDEPLIASEFEVARVHRFTKGSGLPIKASVIGMIEIGAGGGSIARVDRLGLLKVGPDSAGADPGPACYGRGGSRPTVTDADLVLGYLDPDFFLGGQMRLDRAAAEGAIGEGVARPLGLSLDAAAWGIHQVVNEAMASAARIHAVERGRDPSAFPLFAFGGAGPVHAYRVAEILRSPALVVPLGAGVTSTVGFLAAPPAFDLVRSHESPLESLDWRRGEALFGEMEREGRALLREAGAGGTVRVRRWCDMRYRGQGHEVRVPVSAGAGGTRAAGRLGRAFGATYRRIYGQTPAGVPAEVLAWRLTVSGARPPLRFPRAPRRRGAGMAALKGTRPAYFPEEAGYRRTPVYDRTRLGAGTALTGPVILEERESTLVVGPRGIARVGRHGTVTVEWAR